MSVVSTRSARALDVPPGWVDQDKLRAMKDQWGRKLLRIADTQSDGKWVVVAPGEGPALVAPSATASGSDSGVHYTLSGDSPASLQLYRLYLPSTTSIASPPPKLSFVRYLQHTSGAVTSMSIADGRLITLGRRTVSIWDLESGTNAEVPLPPSKDGDILQTGTVVFDDRRCITACSSTLLVHRFD
ncbi:hypothetical protein MKEN_00685100 [Mycena kentingensis (nom. inval.)]|nr:hypothetical protein MKEN_00685100 [Mycena kentingensis (nom. inval.)]